MFARTLFKSFFAFLFFPHLNSSAQTFTRNIRTAEYRQMQVDLCKGWNTWYNNSILTHALLPEGFAINLCISTKDNKAYLKGAFKASEILNRSEKVSLGLRSEDGSYTSLTLQYLGINLTVETATDGDDEIILVSPAKSSENFLIVEAGLLWNKEGLIGMTQNKLTGKFANKFISVSSTATPYRSLHHFHSASFNIRFKK